MKQAILFLLLSGLVSACGGSSDGPAAPSVPAIDYSGSWSGRGAQWTADNVTFTVQGTQITAMTMTESLWLSPMVNLGGGQFAVGCRRRFTLAAPVSFRGSEFSVTLNADDTSGSLVVKGTFVSATSLSGVVEAFTAPNACGYTSTGKLDATTWTAQKAS